MSERSPVEQNLLQWLATGQNACMFARSLAGKHGPRLHTVTRDGIESDEAAFVSAAFELAAASRKVPFVIYPNARSEEDIAKLIGALSRDERWRIRPGQWRNAGEATESTDGCEAQTDALVRVTWKTPADEWSNVMGLAPLCTMPVTRRAPYVTLVVWPGGRENEFKPLAGSGSGPISFADMSHGFDKEQHDATWEQSAHNTAELLSMPREMSHTRNLTFRLHERVNEMLAPIYAQTASQTNRSIPETR